jgi:hypothetical protein
MTQGPYTTEPDSPGPFDQPRPGYPSSESVTETSSSIAYPGQSTTDTDPMTTPGWSSGASSDSESTVGTAKKAAKNVADTAKGEAKKVADTALSSGQDVAQTAKEEARNVAAEAKQQAVSLLDTVRTEVGQQAGTQQGRIAEALHSLSKELGGMAASSDGSGPLTDLAQQASRKGGEVAHWLQEREPADVLEAVRSYGRRRPVTFLALCGLAGVVAGRLTRSAVATRTDLDTNDDSRSSGRRELGSNYATGPSSGYAAASDANYVTAPGVEPVTQPADPISTGVYGGSVESTEPATGTSDVSDPPLPGGGYVGTTSSVDDPGDGPTR